jgi:hypothetical protein
VAAIFFGKPGFEKRAHLTGFGSLAEKVELLESRLDVCALHAAPRIRPGDQSLNDELPEDRSCRGRAFLGWAAHGLW